MILVNSRVCEHWGWSLARATIERSLKSVSLTFYVVEVSVNQLMRELLLLMVLLLILTVVQAVEVLLAIFAMPATLLRVLAKVMGG
ncbi:hypothetical protein D3C80_1532810 [compost metagenome]